MADCLDMFPLFLYLFALLQGTYQQTTTDLGTPAYDTTTADDMVTVDDFIEEDYSSILGKTYMVYVHPKIGDSEQTYISGNTTTIFEELQFQCLLIKVHPAWFYDIMWYINNIQIPIGSIAVSAVDLPSAVLREQHWSPGFKLGMEVSCAIAARFSPHAISGPFQRSKPFFAGLHILNPSLSVQEGETKTVYFRSSVPLACWKTNGISQRCHLQFEAVTRPCHQYCPRWSTLSVNGPASLKFCGPVIDSAKWNDKVQMKVTGFSSDMYSSKLSYTETTARRHIPLFGRCRDVWDGVVLPPIQVHVLKRYNNSYNSSSCYAQNGLHIRTFSGRSYENEMDGIYVLYQHAQLPYSVHLMLRRCSSHDSKPICIEGVAVQSAEDIFIMTLRNSGYINQWDRYKYIKKLSIVKTYGSFRSGIRVVRGQGFSPYEIYLPSGTRIKIGGSISYVYVYPSSYDRDQSEGLCGSFGADHCNDFLFRDGVTQLPYCLWPPHFMSYDEYRKQATDFILSWHVQRSENLFLGVLTRLPTDPPKTFQGTHCPCKFTAALPTWDGLPTQCSFECSLYPPRTDCIYGGGQDVTSFYTSSFQQKLQMEMLDLEDDDPSMSTFYYDTRAQNATLLGGWTTESARTYCEAFMRNHPVYLPCKNVPNVDFGMSVTICMLDIQLTGETSWATLARESFKEQCQNEVFKNNTLWTTKDGEYILERLGKSSCPLDCNNVGHCINWTCQCDEGFGGPDCSVDMGVPPNLIIPKSGLCDLSSKSCKATKVYGRSFIESQDLTCRMAESQVDSRGLHPTGHVENIKAIFVNANEVICPLPKHMGRRTSFARKPWLSAYRVSISNNGRDFSENATVLPYDPACFECAVQYNTWRCVLRVGFCYIDKVCRPSMSSDARRPCRVCDPAQSKSDWSFNGDVIYSWTERETCGSSLLEAQMILIIVGMILSLLVIF